ncbi:uncharacterized protein [Watersipora subatra]|uniref:uncharacterized protein n=1 Tax=Watersipora subatra TaxID=2589382 RepID=UPI00355B8685
MVKLKGMLMILLQVSFSTGYYANLCFNRKITMDCRPAGKAYENGIMQILSATVLLSSDAAALERNNDGSSCTSVEYECTTALRNSTRDEITNRAILSLFDHIMEECNGKTTCYLEMPNWNFVSGTVNDCSRRFPSKANFYLRGVYLDITCLMAVATTMPTYINTNRSSTWKTTNSSTPMAGENVTANDTTVTRDYQSTIKEKQKETTSKKPEATRKQRAGASKDVNAAYINSANIITCSVATFLITFFIFN